MTEKTRRTWLIIVAGFLPLLSGMNQQLLGSVVPLYVLNTSLALILLLLMTTIRQSGELDQWFLERLNSVLSLALLIGFMADFSGRTWLDSTTFATFSSLTLPISLYFLMRRFNAKNVVILISQFYLILMFSLPSTSFLFLVMTAMALLTYVGQVFIGRWQWRLSIFTSLLLLVFGSLAAFTPGLSLTTDAKQVWLHVGILLGLGVLALWWMKSQIRIQLNWRLVVSLSFLGISVLSAQLLGQLATIDAVFFMEIFLYALVLINIFGDIRLPRDHRKLSVIIPTYNAAETIVETLQSIKAQTYLDWEVIIVNDGSTDETSEVVQRFLAHTKLPFFYYEQANADQLNAIKTGLAHISGDIVYVLHSDDKLYDHNVFARAVSCLSAEKADGLFIDLQEIDGNEVPLKKHYTRAYYPTDAMLVKTALAFGRNPFVDFTYWRRDVFETIVAQNYLTDNLPAWYDAAAHKGLRMINANFIGLYYRVFTGNYLNSADGSINVLSGEWRMLHHLLAHFKIPAYHWQSLFYRGMNKLHLSSLCPVIFWHGTTPLTKITAAVARRRLSDFKSPYVAAVTQFAAHYQATRRLEIALPPSLKIYDGADIRLFNRAVAQGTLDPFYKEWLADLAEGPGILSVPQGQKHQVERLLEFFTVKDYVEIKEQS